VAPPLHQREGRGDREHPAMMRPFGAVHVLPL